MVNTAALVKREASNVVPLGNKRLQAIEGALAAVAPQATPGQLQVGAEAILVALARPSSSAPRRRATSSAIKADEWQKYPDADGPVFEGWSAGLRGLVEFAKSPLAHALGPPARYAREILMEAATLGGAPNGRPAVHAMQVAARVIHERRKTTKDVWQAYTVLRVARDLRASATSDGRLTVFEKNGAPDGSALEYVRAIHAATGGNKIEGSRWPAAYVQADRLIQATDNRFIRAKRKQYPKLVVRPYADEPSSPVGQVAEGPDL